MHYSYFGISDNYICLCTKTRIEIKIKGPNWKGVYWDPGRLSNFQCSRAQSRNFGMNIYFICFELLYKQYYAFTRCVSRFSLDTRSPVW